MSFRSCVVSAAILALVSGSARADDASDCRGPDAERAIAGCSALISRGGETSAAVVARYNRAIAYLRRQRAQEAVQDLTVAIDSSAVIGLGSTEKAEFHGQRGLAWRLLGRFDLAIADYTQAIANNGRNAIYYVGRGEALEGSARHGEALADFAAAARLSPTLARARIGLGRAQAVLGQNEESLASYTEAIRLDPRSAALQVERADILTRMGRLDEAATGFASAIALDPRLARAYHGRGIVSARKAQYAAAVADFDAALKLSPRFALAWIDRGNTYLAAGDLPSALASYDEALRHAPGSAVAHANRGFAKWRGGRAEEGLADLVRAVAIDPANVEAQVNRAEVLLQLGRFDEAAEGFLAASKLAPRLEAARAGLRRVTEARRVPSPGATPPLVAAAPPSGTTPPSALTPPVFAPQPSPPPLAVAGIGRRVALVIGNAAYKNTTALINPTNDSADIAAALRRIGFEVIEERNLGKREMDDAFRRFARAVVGADVSLFFYAGHAMQHSGTNYLMPVDAALKEETDLKYEMAILGDVLADMDKAGGVRIAVIDACRDNPLEQKLKRSIATRSGAVTRGLAPMTKVDGSFYVFATLPGNVAEDGAGRNSPFTEALLRHIEAPDMELNTLFRRVAGSVKLATRGRQVPEMTSSVTEDVFLAAKR